MPVGLAGAWGSGKSTIVELLKQALADRGAETGNPEVLVYVFDAWRHEGDPLRRTFIETLATELKKCRWVSADAFKDDLEVLSRRREEVTVSSEPVLTWSGWIAAASVIVGMPLGDAFVAAKWSGGVWIALVPIWMALTLGFLALIRRRKAPSEADKGLLSALGDLLKGLLNNHRTVNRSAAIRSPEPTSVEFENLFTRVVQNALQTNGRERRLVIVIDNLDRVPTKESAQLWATMRLFAEAAGVWVIVPYATVGPDPWVPSFMLEFSDINVAPPGAEPEARPRSMAEKTFRLVMRVPPPILSEWQTFFLSRIAKVLPTHSADDHYAVFRTYRDLEASPTSLPTPRAIITYLNRLVAIHRLWGDTIPLATQAAYLAVESSRSLDEGLVANNLGTVLQPGVIASLEALDPQYRENLAALHTGMEPQIALQVVTKPRLEAALVSGDTEQIQQLASLPGFAEYCREVVGNQLVHWTQSEPATMFAAMRALHAVTRSEPVWTTVWNSLARGLQQVSPPWPDWDMAAAEAVAALIQHVQPDHRQPVAEQALAAWGDVRLPEGPEAARKWVEASRVLLRVVKDCGVSPSVMRALSLPGDGQTSIRILEQLEADDEHLLNYLWAAPTGDILSVLADHCITGQLGPADLHTVAILVGHESISDWEGLRGAIQQRLSQVNPPIPADQLQNLLELAAAVSVTDREFVSLLQPTLAGGQLLSHLNGVDPSIYPKPVAIVTVGMMMAKINPGTNQAWAVGQSRFEQARTNPNGDVLAEMSRVTSKFWGITDLLYLDQPLFEPTVGHLIKSMAEAELTKDQDGYPAEQFVTDWPHLERLVDASMRRALIQHELHQANMVTTVITMPFDPERYTLYLTMLSETTAVNEPNFIDWLIGKITLISSDEWWQAVQGVESNVLVTLALKLGSVPNVSLELGAPLYTGLMELINQGGWRGSDEAHPRLQELVQLLDDDYRITFLRTALERMIAQPEPYVVSLSWLRSLWLVNPSAVLIKADELARHLWPYAIRHRDVNFTRWLMEEFRDAEVVDRCEPESVRTLLGELQEDKDWIVTVHPDWESVVARLKYAGRQEPPLDTEASMAPEPVE